MKRVILTDIAVAGSGVVPAGTVIDEALANPLVLATMNANGVPTVEYTAQMQPVIDAFLKQRADRGEGGAPDLAAALLHANLYHPAQWSVQYANAAERLADTFTAADLGIVAWQTDDNSFWRLRGVSPVLWGREDGGGLTYGPTTAQHVYLSPTQGNDSRDGSAGNWVQTWSRVWEFLPNIQRAPFVVHVDGGDTATLATLTAYVAPPGNTQIGDAAFIEILGDGAGVGVNTGKYLVPGGALTVSQFFAGGGSALNDEQRVVVPGPLAVDAFRRCSVEFTSGAAIGCRRSVVQNDATTLWLGATLAGKSATTISPVASDTLEVFRPNARLDLTAAVAAAAPLPFLLAPPETKIVFANVGIYGGKCVVGSKHYTQFFGVEFDSLYYIIVAGVLTAGTPAQQNTSSSTLRVGAGLIETERLLGPLSGAGDISTNNKWMGWGLMQPAAINVAAVYVGLYGTPGWFQGTVCGGSVQAYSTGYAGLYGGDVSRVLATSGASAELDNYTPDTKACRVRVDGALWSSGTLLVATQNNGRLVGGSTGWTNLYVNAIYTNTKMLSSSLGGEIRAWWNYYATSTLTSGSAIAVESEAHGRMSCRGSIISSGPLLAFISMNRGSRVNLVNMTTMTHVSDWGIQVHQNSDLYVSASTLSVTTSSTQASSVEGYQALFCGDNSRVFVASGASFLSSAGTAGGGYVLATRGGRINFATTVTIHNSIGAGAEASIVAVGNVTQVGGYVYANGGRFTVSSGSMLLQSGGGFVPEGDVSGLAAYNGGEIVITNEARLTGTGTNAASGIRVAALASNQSSGGRIQIWGLVTNSMPSGAVRIDKGGTLIMMNGMTTTAGCRLWVNGGEVISQAAITATSGARAGEVPLEVRRGGRFRIENGNLNLVANNTAAAWVDMMSEADLGSTPILTGAVGNPGIQVSRGSKVRAGVYTSITESGAGAGDLQLDNLAPVANTAVLLADYTNYNNISAGGGGSMMLRAA